MTQFDDLFNYGMMVTEKYVAKSFIYKGVTYSNGILKGTGISGPLTVGGKHNEYSDILVVRLGILPNQPVIGDRFTVNGIVLEAILVEVESNTYTITLTSKGGK